MRLPPAELPVDLLPLLLPDEELLLPEEDEEDPPELKVRLLEPDEEFVFQFDDELLLLPLPKKERLVPLLLLLLPLK